ncbi:MAG: acyl-CoA synthetase [Leptospiraceae bacterium]|nr:MAG: acyl-CoA synthetase [Leptospiraceae bacterium]
MQSSEFNLTQYIIEKNENNINKIALLYIENKNEIIQYTYKEIFEKILKIAHYLSKYKISNKEQFLLLRMPSNPNVLFYFFGSILAGFIPIPISRMLTTEEIEFIINDAKPDIIIYEHLPLPKIQNQNIKIFEANQFINEITTKKYIQKKLPETYYNDPAFMIYTSGTTGKPKGVIHAQRNIIGRIPIQKEWIDITYSDILLHAGELNWTYTLGVGIMDVWANSRTSILVGDIRKDLSIWTWIMQHFPVTIFATVPSLYRRIIKYHREDLSQIKTLRHCLTAGEALKPELWKQWTELTQKPLYEALGMTEISTYISSGPNVPTKPGSPGKPQKGRNVRIISSDSQNTEELPEKETGLIAVHKSDPGLMLRYLNRPEEEQLVFRNEWFIGGDLAYKDEDGYFWFQGRNNDLMKSFGYRVSPIEIESILEKHPYIQEACVCEIQKNKEISLITAFVVKDLAHHLTESDIIEYCKSHLAEYKCPRKVIFLKELPRNSSGKILKNILKQEYNYKI